MESELQPALKFRPERPIYLNENNTGFKTKIEVLHAIQNLRAKYWLCAYNEQVRPFHMSFNSELEFQEFKKTCQDLNITLKQPLIKPDDTEDIFSRPEAPIIPEEPQTSHEDPSGIIQIETEPEKPTKRTK